MREWKRAASQASRRLKAEGRRERLRVREARAREHAARVAAMRAALERRPESAADAVARLLAGAPDDPRLRELLGAVAARSPRLLDADLLGALRLVAQSEWVRPPATWRPAAKSAERLFRGLAEHVLARYRVAPFVWTAFTADEDAPILARVAVHVAGGGSLYRAVTSGLLPVPLTRGQCHDLLTSTGDVRFLAAVRAVQVRAAGGDTRLLRAWLATPAGRRLHGPDDERFWQGVLAWFCAHPMPPQDVGPLVDYVQQRRAATPGFSMKGRSLLALRRGMREWHRELARARDMSGRVFAPSGFEPMDLDRSRPARWGNPKVTEVWHVREILDGRTLADEGRAMGHCVYSYGRAIAAGQCAIWTLTLRDDTGHWRRLTIEVRPAQRQIVQARGRFNGKAEPRDLLVLEQWASRNRLTLALGRW